MRTMLLASAALLCVGGTALAQTADSGPMSTKATHIMKADTGGTISPRLPSPNLGGDASPDQYLMKAKSDTQAGRTGAAQEALERAETRLLDRSTAQDAAMTPDPSPRVEKIRGALHALASRDRNGAIQMIDAAMGDTAAGAAPMPTAGATMPAMPNMPAMPMAKAAPLNTPIAPGGTSGMTPATATGGNATGTSAATGLGAPTSSTGLAGTPGSTGTPTP